MRRLQTMAQLLVAIVAFSTCLAIASPVYGGVITVGNGDFAGSTYELRYYTRSEQLYQNGVGTAVSHESAIQQLFLTNNGNTNFSAWGPGDRFNAGNVRPYLMAPGRFGGFGGGASSTYNTSAAATMGFDLSGVTGSISKVELVSRNAIFQFAQWVDEAFGDTIYGSVATPNSFGNGVHTDIYRHTSNNLSGTGPGALITDGLIDLTPLLTPSWLSDPELLELKFGYELLDTDIPGRHLQLFRDDTGNNPDNQGFLLRVTLADPGNATVPEPTSIAIFGLIPVLVGLGRRRRA